MGRKMERSVLNFACDLFLFCTPCANPAFDSCLGTGTGGGPTPCRSESAHPWVRRKGAMLGMALIGGTVLIRIYFLVSVLRERRQGTDKETTATWLEGASSTYVSVCVCVRPSVSCFKANIGTLVG